MPYVDVTSSVDGIQAFFREIPVLGWWATTPFALAYGVLFWNLLSLALLCLQKHLSGDLFTSQVQKISFFTFAGGTTVAQLLIYIYTGSVYITAFNLQNHGYNIIYITTLALLLIAALHFFTLLISFIVGRLKRHQT